MEDVQGILPKVEQLLRDLQGSGKSGKTLASYGETISAFCNWCAHPSREYLISNPVDGLAKFDTTPQVIRRLLTAVEIRSLLDAAPSYRRLLYGVSFCTGLRAKELRNLTTHHLDVESKGLVLDAQWTKNRKRGFQPLPGFLVECLVDFMEAGSADQLYRRFFSRSGTSLEKLPTAPLLYVPQDTARMINSDLKAAGIEKETLAGKVDFHAARVAYVSHVVSLGASVKEAQTLARHATPELTLNTYARTESGRLSEITEDLGTLLLDTLCRKRAHNNGTTDNATEDEEGVSELTPRETASYDNSQLAVRAERGGFEPPVPCGTQHFQCCTIGHSVISPKLEGLLSWPSRQSCCQSKPM